MSLKRRFDRSPVDALVYLAHTWGEAVAVKLGKALFWDMQAGGDGKHSCASCHNAAGADNRTRNTLNPHGSADYPVNADVTASMFPIKTALAVGSAGVRQTTFTGLADPLQANSGFPADLGTSVPDTVFYLGGANLRHVTERQALSVINSVYYFLSNWDGSARETFNLETAVDRLDSSTRPHEH